MREKSRVDALSGGERQNVVADDALKPLDSILAGHADLSPGGQIHDPDGVAYCTISGGWIPIMSRDFPSGLFDEDRAALGVVFVERRSLHVFLTTSWTRARVLEENSLRETIFVTP